MAIKGILFDKDGTLLDYAATWMPLNHHAARLAGGGDEALAEHLLAVGGYDPESGRVRSGSLLAAGTNAAIAACWAAEIPGGNPAELTALLERVFMEGGRRSATPVTALRPLLVRLKARGLALGVATSDSLGGARASLAGFDILELLDFLAGYDSGFAPKPEPGMVDGFRAATGLAAAEVAVVGDNPHDLEMGRAAGAGLLVGVLTGTSLREELSDHADHVLDSIAGLEELLDGM